MAEIKSTIDLVMQKTRDMSLDRDEREKMKQNEFQDKARSWILKHLQGESDIPAFRMEYESWKKSLPHPESLLQQEVLAKLKPEQNASTLLRLLAELLQIDSTPLLNTLNSFENDISQEREKYQAEQKSKFAAAGIQGSALLPNPEKDQAWNSRLQELEAELKHSLQASLQEKTST